MTSKADVLLTFDNLGEAASLERGEWPPSEPVGKHHSVTSALPRILEALSQRHLLATFFIEGWNAITYPDALRRIVGAGHEVAYHGWRHEDWSSLTEAREAELLDQGLTAFDSLGIQAIGFRPPEGHLIASSMKALKARGLKYAAPLDGPFSVQDGLAVMPIDDLRWVDAWYYIPEVRGDAEDAPEQDLFDGMARAIEESEASGNPIVLVFHPYVEDPPGRFARFEAVLDLLKERTKVWRVADAAEELLEGRLEVGGRQANAS